MTLCGKPILPGASLKLALSDVPFAYNASLWSDMLMESQTMASIAKNTTSGTGVRLNVEIVAVLDICA